MVDEIEAQLKKKIETGELSPKSSVKPAAKPASSKPSSSLNLSDVQKGKIVVLIIPNEQYTSKMGEISRHFSNTFKATTYVSLNKLLNSLTQSLEESKVDTGKFLFIDGITKSANPNLEEKSNVIYIQSAAALTQMSLTINKALSTEKFEGLLFDSLSTLLVYNKGDVVVKFVRDLINKIKQKNVATVFTALEGDTDSALLKDISMYVDKVEHVK